ncbi:complex I NDUFA9 subunit family protein [Sphingomonas flavalba]|uniref:complex I NDUFA9 subunit family protein n=1 Tax=Sphingomonas flavalba TaxID=2559804 RepID=UPI0039E0E3C3
MKDKLVTLFGGGGFIGRYTAQALLRAGARVRIAQRDPRAAWYLKPLGGLGQTQFVASDLRHADSVARAVAGADAVVNLVGILKGDFNGVHAEGAAHVAKAARAAGADALVHVSALGANATTASRYGRSKAEGETRVRAAFPEATILRPSTVFGREDGLTNRIAGLIRMLPVVPVIAGSTRLQPVFAVDVADAIVASLSTGSTAGQTLALGGPEVVDMQALYTHIASWIDRGPALITVPDGLASLATRLGGWVPGAPMTHDQWLMLQQNYVVGAEADGLSLLGITPTPMAAVAPDWLVQYRRRGRFALTKTPA